MSPVPFSLSGFHDLSKGRAEEGEQVSFFPPAIPFPQNIGKSKSKN